MRLALERLLAKRTPGRRSWWPTTAWSATAGVIALASVCGLLTGVAARLMDVYGSVGIARVGAGVAAWITLAFWTARRSERAAGAVSASAVFLLTWLAAYYTSDAVQQGVPLRTMWPLARVWVALLVPAAVFIGVSAWRSRRCGIAGDAALALPLSWSLAETFLWAARTAPVSAWLLEGSLLLGLASALVVSGWRQRRVNWRTFAASVIVGVATFALAAAVWFWTQRP